MADEPTQDVSESADRAVPPATLVAEPNVINHPLQAIETVDTSAYPVKDAADSKSEHLEAEVVPAASIPVDISHDTEPPSDPSDQPSLRTKLLPHRQKKKQPKRGILKAPPPPVKPGLGGKLRDALGSIHPKFLDYAVGPIGNGTAASVAESIPPSISVPVNNLASNVMEGVGVVGGAAAAVVGSWGGRFGKLVGAAAGSASAAGDNHAAGSPAPATLPWRFATRMTGGSSSPPVAASTTVSRMEKELPTTPTKSAGFVSSSSGLPGSPLQISNESTTITIITDTYRPLKRASFILPAISITYPISSANPPWSDKVLQDRRQVEESATRMMQSSVGAAFWNGEKLVELYEIACAGREESARVGIKQALSVMSVGDKPGQRQLLLKSGRTGARTAFFSVDPPLGKYAAQAFADVLSVEWGLARMALQDGILDHDESLKPILHALLISGTLPQLSLSGNRKIKSPGWRMVAAYIKKARALRFLDLSSNNLDKKSVEYLSQAISAVPAPPSPEAEAPSLESKDGNESDDSQTEECYGPIPRVSHSTLLKNSHLGGKDAPGTLQTLRLDDCGLRAASLDILAQAVRRSDIRNLSLRQNKISNLGTVSVALIIRDWVDTGSTGNNPFNNDRHVLFDMETSRAEDENGIEAQHEDVGGSIPHSIPLQDEHLGRLVTLDLKGNDIRGGVNYIAQVLKRNTHLKVLNLSENRIDAVGLASLAEALRLNQCLETLDLSHNPCCGPALDGTLALRHTFPSNTTLRRLFLNATQMTDESAIALAEALSDANRLLHIDLTDNDVTLAGAMALAGSLRSNTSIRCLDLTIPQNDADLSEISQSILQTCIRNTEAALNAKGTTVSNGAQDAVWAPIKNSSLVKRAKEAEDYRKMSETVKAIDTPAAIARTEAFTLKPAGVIRSAEESAEYGQRLLEQQKQPDAAELDSTEKQRCMAALDRNRALLERISDIVQETEDPERLERLLSLNDQLTTQIPEMERILAATDKRLLVTTAKSFLKPPPTQTPSPKSLGRLNTAPVRRHMKVPSLEASPNFSITNSDDDDSDAEELHSAGPVSLKLAIPERPPSHAFGNLGALGYRDTDDAEDKRVPLTISSSTAQTWQSLDSCSSPLERVNKEWMAEEGEIFRKGQKLGVADEDHELGDFDDPGSALKQKILEAEVERTPHHLREEINTEETLEIKALEGAEEV